MEQTAGTPLKVGPRARGAPAPSNREIAEVFSEIADLLELQDDNPFRVRAYRNAARTVSAFAADIASIVRGGGSLPKLPGIGDDLADKMVEIAATGDCAVRRQLRRQVPAALVTLLQLPGLGPKRVQALHRGLGIKTVQQLLAAARAGRVSALPGFGRPLQQKLLGAIERRLQTGRRTLLAEAQPQAERCADYLRGAPGLTELTIAGSLRRSRETIGDIDLVGVAADGAKVTATFVKYPQVREVLSHGPTRASVLLRSGLQVDLRVVAAESGGAALAYFTGSKAHVIAIRRLAQRRGLKINEYGVFKGSRRIAGETEASVYRALDLPPIPPELREDRGEIDAAAAGRLPRLIERGDLRGDLHVHTRASDGLNTLEEMAAAARAAGLEYLAITEHSRRLAIAHGLDSRQLLRQIENIDRLNERLRGITLLKGIEVDILEDGRLDLPDDILRRLDVVIIAIHSHLGLPRDQQTARLLRALDHPCVTILAHPTARLLGEREAIALDLPAVIAAVGQRGCALELNAQPARMDLPDHWCRQAAEQGVPICLNSDAHSVGEFANLDFGIGQARRGWLEAEQVLNTRSLTSLRKFLRACSRR